MTRLLLLLMAALLTACISPPTPQNTQANAGRYAMADDVPTLEPIDLSAVQPVIPVAVERTLAGNKSPYTVNGNTYQVMGSESGYEETGTASWYGRKFHGHLTSNGEVYDMFALSAAHKSLPIPSFLEVTNLANGKSVVVRVNDRGPFHGGRIVDLSYAAAAMLDYADKGTARVRIRSVLPQTSQPVIYTQTEEVDPAIQEQVLQERALIEQDSGNDFLQVGAFSNLDSAKQLLAQVSTYTTMPVFIRSDRDVNTGGLLHRVRLGPVNETMDIQNLTNILVNAGLGKPFRVRQ